MSGPRTCPTCQAELRDTALFCPACGNAVGVAAPPAPGATGKPAADAAPTEPPAPTTEPAGRPSRRTLTLAAGFALAALLVAVAAAAVLLGGGESDQAVAPTTTAAATGGALPPATVAPASEEASTDPGGATPGGAAPASDLLQPVEALATNERAGVNLRCPPNNFVSYDASLLIDGDENTGWGASSSDGTGQSITVRFAGDRHLTSVGLTPGYTKFGPRADQNCASVSAFPFNRFVTSVEYRFDDGTTAIQQFEQSPGLQTMPVDVVTRSVQITVLGTVRPVNADDDTIISEAAFEGYVE